MDGSELLFEQQGSIAVLTLNRPEERNPLTGAQLAEELVEVTTRIHNDLSVKVVILTGSGSAFSSGGNVKEMLAKKGMFEGDAGEIRENYQKGIQRIPLCLYHLDVPTIAAVNGPAIGAGCDLACMCDIRVASTRAKFGETFAALGLIPGDGGAFFLPRLVGHSRARELAFTCRVIDAEEALRIGMVSEVTRPEELMSRCLEIAGEISRQPARTLRLAKRLFTSCEGKTLESALELSAAYQSMCHQMPEHTKAVQEFFTRWESKRKS